MLKKGDKVKIKSLEWFKEKCYYISDKLLIYNYVNTRGKYLRSITVTSDMLDLCESVVTIEKINLDDSISISELNNRCWVIDFFEGMDIFNFTYLAITIDLFCNDYCMFKDCNNSKCPLYKVYKRIKTISDINDESQLSDFFGDLSFSLPIYSIDLFCNEYCIFISNNDNDNKSCNNLECPLYCIHNRDNLWL